MVASIGPNGGQSDMPDRYEAANGVEAGIPGQADGPGTRDPSSPTPVAAVAAELARIADLEQHINAPGGCYYTVDLPSVGYQ
jgi:hypothetical protein